MGSRRVETEKKRPLAGPDTTEATMYYEHGKKVAEGSAIGTDENAAAAAREDMADNAAEKRESE
jgi:hypothetical protein